MLKGELTVFCKDFGIAVPLSKQLEIYRKVSHEPLNIDSFKAALPQLGLEMAKGKVREIQYRLREIKTVLEFPDATRSLHENIELLICDVDKVEVTRLGKPVQKMNITKKKIPEIISKEEESSEKLKTDKILTEIEKIMRNKRYCADQDRHQDSMIPKSSRREKAEKIEKPIIAPVKAQIDDGKPKSAKSRKSEGEKAQVEVKPEPVKQAASPSRSPARSLKIIEKPLTEQDYMLKKQPSSGQTDQLIHPLYSEYERLLKQIPSFKEINTEEKAIKMMD